MWANEAPRRIFAYTTPTDMRKSFTGLLALVQQVFREHDPYAGTWFVFVNRRANLVKVLAWDRTGFILCAKRLERGRFQFPADASSQELSESAFRFLMDGIALGKPRSMR
jgi:transposase